MPTWDEELYLKFADQRTRPARELLGRIPLAAARRVVDLGCGPGNSTALLRARWPDAQLTGVDDSAEMLQRARRELPAVEWVEADAGSFVPSQPVDVLFSNALLQWLPAHDVLLPRLLQHVLPGGAFAFQVPHNFDEPSHRAMRETPGPWASRTAAVRSRSPVESPEFYYDLLAPSARAVDIWETRYEHVMAGPAEIVDWVKGTGLRPYLEVLTPPELPLFLEAYTRAIDVAYPARRDGKRLFSFPRLFVVALC